MIRRFLETKGHDTYKGLVAWTRPGLHREVVEVLGELVPPGARVADLGAGTGAMVARLRDLGYEALGFDLRPQIFGLNPDLLVEVDFRDQNKMSKVSEEYENSFDAALCLQVMEHTPNPWAVAHFAWKLLRPGGIFIITLPNVENLLSRFLFLLTGRFLAFSWSYRGEDPTTGHINPITSHEMRYILTHLGFEVLLVEPAGEWPWMKRQGSWPMRLVWPMLFAMAEMAWPLGPLRRGWSYMVVAKKTTSTSLPSSK